MSDHEAVPETGNATGEAAGTGSETGEQQDEQSDERQDNQQDDQHDDGVSDESNASSVAPPPAARVELASPSRSADAGHMASADISSVASAADLKFRLVGGNAISLLVWAHEIAAAVPERETNDADLGVPALATGSANLVAALTEKGYKQVEGNRFVRYVEHAHGELELFIDVLVPSYTGRLQTNQPFGDLVVDAIPGLAIAIALEPTVVEVVTTLTTGEVVEYTVPLPHPLAAMCMKAYAYRWRLADRDAIDVWRLAEVAHALGLTQEDWPAGATGREAAAILHQHFATPGAGGPVRATTDRGAQARIRALVLSLVPPPSA